MTAAFLGASPSLAAFDLAFDFAPFLGAPSESISANDDRYAAASSTPAGRGVDRRDLLLVSAHEVVVPVMAHSVAWNSSIAESSDTASAFIQPFGSGL